MLLFMDGMAHYDTSRIALKYSVVNTTNVTWAVAAEGRFGNCIKRTTVGVNNDGYLAIAPLTTRLGPWVTDKKRGVCGFAVKVDDLLRVSAENLVIPNGKEFFTLMEGAQSHVGVILNPDGTFSLWRQRFSSTTDLLAISSEGLQSGAWAYIEFKWFIDGTVGTFEIRANGVVIMNFTGNTLGSQYDDYLGIWSAVHLLTVKAASSSPVVLRMCDLYLADCDSADADDVSDFLGDGVIDTIMPNGPGSSTGWTPSSGANWDTTNDLPAPDDDGTYVSTATPGTQDTYNFQDIPAGAEVKGVHINILSRKETEGSSTIAPVIHQGGTDYVGPSQGVANIVYDRYITQAYDLNPATMAKFTAAEINAGEFGVKKVI